MSMKQILILLLTSIICISCSKETGSIDSTVKNRAYSNVEEFCDSTTNDLTDYVCNRISQTIEDKTNVLSLQLFIMSYNSIFKNDSVRKQEWLEAFFEHGLSKDSIEYYINAGIDIYNREHTEDKINLVRLSPIVESDIISEDVFTQIKRTEWLACFDCFDLIFPLIPGLNILIFYIIFPIGFIIGLFFIRPIALAFDIDKETMRPILKYLSTFIVWLVTFFLCLYLSSKYSLYLESEAIKNYMDYLNNQNIFMQMLN